MGKFRGINMEYENKDICRVCKKKCCKKCGCDYYVEDFEVINKESMIKILDTGNVSVVSSMVIKDLKKKKELSHHFFIYELEMWEEMLLIYFPKASMLNA